jgi:hypothetical protein
MLVFFMQCHESVLNLACYAILPETPGHCPDRKKKATCKKVAFVHVISIYRRGAYPKIFLFMLATTPPTCVSDRWLYRLTIAKVL